MIKEDRECLVLLDEHYYVCINEDGYWIDTLGYDELCSIGNEDAWAYCNEVL